VSRASEALETEGAADWYRAWWRRIEKACEYAVSDVHSAPRVVELEVIGKDGEVEVKTVVVPAARAADVAKAAEIVAGLTRQVGAALGLQGCDLGARTLEEDRARMEALRGAAIERAGKIIASGKDGEAAKVLTEVLDRTGLVAEKKVAVGFDMELLREFLSGNPEKAWEEPEAGG
jgi:hypothetical protein